MAHRGGGGGDDRAAKQARLRRLKEIEHLEMELQSGFASDFPSTDTSQKAQPRKGGGKGNAGSRGNALLRDSAGASSSHGGKGSSGGASAKLDRSRANMWLCGQCGFTDNFAFKTHCHGCQAPRPARAGGQSGGSNAGRPPPAGGSGGVVQWTSVQASSRARGTSPSSSSSPSPPTSLSSPTVSLASRPAVAPLGAGTVASGRATPPAPRVGDGSVRSPVGANGYGPMLSRGSKPDAPKPVVADEQGFTQPVRGRFRQPRDDKSWLKPREDFPPLQPSVGAKAQDAPADSSEQSMGTGKGQGGSDVITIDDDSSVHSAVPTLDQLREAYDASQRMLRTVEAMGDATDDNPVLFAARAARDQARAAFEAARPARPAHLRMRPVEQRLERARRACDATRGKMHQLQIDYKFRLSELEMELDGAEDRLSKAQAEYDSVLSQLPRSRDDRARAERCHGVLRALGAAGPQLQGIAESLLAVSPVHAEGIRRVVADLDHEYKETTAAVQNDTAYFRIDEAEDEQFDEEDGEMEHDLFSDGPVQPAPPAAGAGAPAAAAANVPVPSLPCNPVSARPRIAEGPLQPPPKRFCDGGTPMESTHGDAENPLTVERCYEMARVANVQVEEDLESLTPLEHRSWAISHGF